MILKPDLIYAEFLKHFVNVLQDEKMRDAASMASGCLRSPLIPSLMGDLLSKKERSYLPLSAVFESGCIVDGMITATPPVSQLKLFFDEVRVQALLNSLDIDHKKYTHVQQILLTVSCQEAVNRVLNGDFKLFAENIANISDFSSQKRILELVSSMNVHALKDLISELHFTDDFKLTETSTAAIKRQQEKFLALAEVNPSINVPEAEIYPLATPITNHIPVQDRIQILNELTLLLAKDKSTFSASELLEYEAHIHLLKIHSNLLAITYNDLWQVKVQLVSVGQEIVSEEVTIVLPYSISQIFDLIKGTKLTDTTGKYLTALKEIQSVATRYESDWYTWTRNHISFLASAPAVKNFLSTVSAIDMGFRAASPSSEEESGLFASILSYGLSFFSAEISDEDEALAKNDESLTPAAAPHS